MCSMSRPCDSGPVMRQHVAQVTGTPSLKGVEGQSTVLPAPPTPPFLYPPPLPTTTPPQGGDPAMGSWGGGTSNHTPKPPPVTSGLWLLCWSCHDHDC